MNSRPRLNKYHDKGNDYDFRTTSRSFGKATDNAEQRTINSGGWGIYINDALNNDREINAAQIQAAIDNAIANHKATAIYNPDSL